MGKLNSLKNMEKVICFLKMVRNILGSLNKEKYKEMEIIFKEISV